MVVVHSCNDSSVVINTVSKTASLGSELEGVASGADLLVELRSDSTVNLIQVLVSQTYLPDGSVRVEESVVNDSCRRCSAQTSLLARLSFGSRYHFPLVEEIVEFGDLLDEGFIIDNVALTLIDRLLVIVVQGLVMAWCSRLHL